MSAIQSEGALQDLIRLELGRYPRELVLWRNSVAVAEVRGHKQRFGLCVGSADLIGMFRERFVAIEIKTPIGRLSPDQKRFRDLVLGLGGEYVVLRSVEEAQQWLVDMRRRHLAAITSEAHA